MTNNARQSQQRGVNSAAQRLPTSIICQNNTAVSHPTTMKNVNNITASRRETTLHK
jgi:hypothetical protein